MYFQNIYGSGLYLQNYDFSSSFGRVTPFGFSPRDLKPPILESAQNSGPKNTKHDLPRPICKIGLPQLLKVMPFGNKGMSFGNTYTNSVSHVLSQYIRFCGLSPKP